jgi:membrane peptidoglycan carboxypeptidase
VAHPVFGKTGTSDFNWTANLAISTKQLAIAATLANPDFAQTPHNPEAPQKTNRAAVHTMRDAMKGLPKIQFIKPPNGLVYGKRVSIPKVECKSVAVARERISDAGFDVTVEDKKIDSKCPAGTVAKTDPSGSTSKGGSVTIFVSNGKNPGGPPPSPAPGG